MLITEASTLYNEISKYVKTPALRNFYNVLHKNFYIPADLKWQPVNDITTIVQDFVQPELERSEGENDSFIAVIYKSPDSDKFKFVTVYRYDNVGELHTLKYNPKAIYREDGYVEISSNIYTVSDLDRFFDNYRYLDYQNLKCFFASAKNQKDARQEEKHHAENDFQSNLLKELRPMLLKKVIEYNKELNLKVRDFLNKNDYKSVEKFSRTILNVKNFILALETFSNQNFLFYIIDFIHDLINPKYVINKTAGDKTIPLTVTTPHKQFLVQALVNHLKRIDFVDDSGWRRFHRD